jgi:hypothetical protein
VEIAVTKFIFPALASPVYILNIDFFSRMGIHFKSNIEIKETAIKIINLQLARLVYRHEEKQKTNKIEEEKTNERSSTIQEIEKMENENALQRVVKFTMQKHSSSSPVSFLCYAFLFFLLPYEDTQRIGK